MVVRDSPLLKSPEYAVLLDKVRKTLVEGQARIEQERVRTYWETGRIIHADILKHKDRADYGKGVIKSLADDLKVDPTVLKRCVRFVRTYKRLPIGAMWHQFSWSHYRELITIPNDTKRLEIEKSALKSNWSVNELALRIKEGKAPVSPKNISTPDKLSVNHKPLTPLRGTLYTYKIVERPNLSPDVESRLLVDLGFGVYHEPDSSRQLAAFSKDQIIESRPKDDVYRFYKTDRTVKELFTYAAYIEKVIDGDTIKVRLDLGFNVWTRQTLRLRDLDCPEVGTKDGDETRSFVRSLMKESQMIIVRSSVSDKYDRYLADVFIPRNSDGILGNTPRASREGVSLSPVEDIYLNNLLLESGRAVRM